MLSKRIKDSLQEGSHIRRAFDEGARLKREFGEQNVFDLSIGNPLLDPPDEIKNSLLELVQDDSIGNHRYMPNAGFPWVRECMSEYLSNELKVKVPSSNILMTCGAAGAISVALHTLLNPGDETIVFAPFFPEYRFYIEHAAGKMSVVSFDSQFLPDLNDLEAKINERTKAILINSPNNPTGCVYPEETVDEMVDLLNRINSRRTDPIVLITDDPYRRLAYDGIEISSPMNKYEHTIVTSSFSKDLGLAGERIGYMAFSPSLKEVELLVQGAIFNLRTLGFVSAPALMQRLVAKNLNVLVEVDEYRKRRDYLFNGLAEIGFEIQKPQGAFFCFPKSPIDDEMEFCGIMTEKRVLGVPGRAFGAPGYVRLSYASDWKSLEGGLSALKSAWEAVG